jgi:hypothetical protein
MKRTLPLGICFIGGVVMVIQFFIPHPISQNLFKEYINWLRIIGAFTIVLGLQSIVMVHYRKVKGGKEGWGYSFVTLGSLVIVAAIGMISGTGEGSLFMKIYRYIFAPLSSTTFSILAFFMASAAYRSFRARTPEAFLLLASALFVMFGRVPIGYFTWHKIPFIVEWILMYPSMAIQRGILLGVGLGIIATSLKMILGIERSWLGGV